MNRLARPFVLVSLAILASCTDPLPPPGAGDSYIPVSDALQQGSPFVGVKRDSLRQGSGGDRLGNNLGPVDPIDIQGDDDHFYLAISKNAMTKRWFLSAFLKQYFPGAV